MCVSLKTRKSKRPNLELFCHVKKGVEGGDNAMMMMMMKINEISNTWERNKTKARTEGGGE
jgi:hypothetical protein